MPGSSKDLETGGVRVPIVPRLEPLALLLTPGVLLLISLVAPGPLQAQWADWIRVGDAWKYRNGKTDPPAGWATVGFDDDAWASARSGLGYGNGDDVTVLSDMKGSYLTFYARRGFAVDAPAQVRRLLLRINYEDGFIAYLNGTEVARRGLGSPGTPVDRTTSAAHRASGAMEAIDLGERLSLLLPGENLLAVEVHGTSLSSANVTFSPALVACGPGPAISRGPYLQLVTGTSATVIWVVDPPGPGAVEYGPTEALGRVAEDPISNGTHEVRLEGLVAGAECFYRILAAGAPVSPTHRFRAAPGREASSFRMAVYGDTEKLSEGLLGAPPVVRSMRPDLAIGMGDLIRDGDVDGYVFDPWREVLPECPVFPALGNHDLDLVEDAYLSIFQPPQDSSKTERYYSFDYGDAHVVSLEVTETDNYGSGSAQRAWLRQDLAATDRTWKIVFFHKSPYSTGTTHGSDLGVRSALCPVFDEFGVDLVFTGHNHNYERSFPVRGGAVTDGSPPASYEDPSGTIYIVTGGAGGTLYAQDAKADKSFSAIFKLTHHVCQVDVDGRRLVLRAVDIDGEVFDTLEVRKSSSPPDLPFTRGDASRDGEIDVADAVTMLLQLFAGAPRSCPDAADADDSGGTDISDVVFLLRYLFLAGDPPPPPLGEAGTDPTPDALGCGG